MRKRIATTLALALLLSPALPLLADAAEPASPTAAVAASATAQADAVPAADPNAPALPDAGGGAQDLTATPSAAGAKDAAVETPKDVPVQPGKAKPDEKPSRFSAGNFVLGFIGGALLGGAAGILLTSPSDQDRQRQQAILGASGAVVGGLLGGTLSLLLGATSPEEARPPKVEGYRPMPMLVASLRF